MLFKIAREAHGMKWTTFSVQKKSQNSLALHLSTISSNSLQQSAIFPSIARKLTKNTNVLAFLWSFSRGNFGSVFTTFSRHFGFSLEPSQNINGRAGFWVGPKFLGPPIIEQNMGLLTSRIRQPHSQSLPQYFFPL